MLALVANKHYYGIVGTEIKKKVDGKTLCIGDTVKVAEGPGHNECVGVIGIFTDKISVMGLGSTPISKLNIVEIIKSHEELQVGSQLYYGHFDVVEFKE